MISKKQFVRCSIVAIPILFSSLACAESSNLNLKPKPRLRIDRSATTIQVQVLDAPTPQTDVVVMDKITVMGKRVVEVPRKVEQEYTGTFSAFQGGVLKRDVGKGVTYEFGLWRPVSVMQADESFKPQVIRAEANLFRLSW